MIPPRLYAGGACRTLAEEVRAIGGVWLVCDERGAVIGGGRAGTCDLVEAIFLHARSFQHTLRSAAPGLVAAGDGSLVELLPGLIGVVCRSPLTPGSSLGLVLLPTFEFAQGDDLLRLANSAGIDPGAARQAILLSEPPDRREIPRLRSLLSFAFRTESERDAEMVASDAVGAQLAATYEEINLLYTLVSGMAVASEPSRFITTVCEELVRTVGFGWAILRLRPPHDRLAGPDGVVIAGNPPFPREALRHIATRLLLCCGSDDGRVFPRGHASLAAMGVAGPVVACPVRHDGRSNGILVAGDRRGPVAEISSVELKLADAAAGHLGLYLENANLYRDLDAMFLGTLEALVAAIDAKDPYTRGHSQRVAAVSRDLARAIGLGEVLVKQVHIAGLVHDVGKIGVSESVLRKPGKLTEDEFEQIRRHPEIGWRILKDIPQLEPMLDGVLSHHERWDGRGYPQGLAGEAIPLVARIIALADSFDAMSSSRTYRAGRSRSVVLTEIRSCAGSQFDPSLVEPFLGLDLTEYDRLVAEHEARARSNDEIERLEAA